MDKFLTLKRRIMARIYLEYTKNMVTEYPDYVMLLVFVVCSLALVSMQNVVSNLPKDSLVSAFNFFWNALINTSWILQALIVGFLVRVSIFGIGSAYRNLKTGLTATKLNFFNIRY